LNPSRHTHPTPRLQRLVQLGAITVAGIMLIAVPMQIVLAFIVGGTGLLFVLSAFFTLLLAAPVLMLTAYTPAVTVATDGITLHPVIWKEQTIPWNAVRAVKVYPLLPIEDAEVTRKLVVGKRNYRPAAGIMLIVPSLPPQYRIAGFFAGEHAAPIIALTNRAHTEYEALVKMVLQYTDPAVHDAGLME
jgi:hypothetical protein